MRRGEWESRGLLAFGAKSGRLEARKNVFCGRCRAANPAGSRAEPWRPGAGASGAGKRAVPGGEVQRPGKAWRRAVCLWVQPCCQNKRRVSLARVKYRNV